MRHSGAAYTKAHHFSGSRSTNTIGGGAPSAPVAGYTIWYDANAITGVADGAALSSWPDSSSNHFDLAQATGARQPTYYKTTAGQLQNNKPVVVFNGGTDMLTSTALIPGVAPTLVQTVVKTSTPTVLQYVFYKDNGPESFYFSTNFYASNGGTFVHGGTPDTAMHVITANLPSTGSAVIRVDGTQVATASITTVLGQGTVRIGADGTPANRFTGTLCEVLYYSGSGLVLADWQANEAYLKAKWGTP